MRNTYDAHRHEVHKSRVVIDIPSRVMSAVKDRRPREGDDYDKNEGYQEKTHQETNGPVGILLLESFMHLGSGNENSELVDV